MIRQTQILLWRLLTLIALALGIVGAVLPILPSVVFFLLAAWAASKGWPAMEARLLAHPIYGDYIRRWRERGAIPRRAKWLATAMMVCSVLMLQLSSAASWLKLGLPLFLCCVGVWLWRRPES